MQKHLQPIHHNDNSRRDNKCKHVKGARTAKSKCKRLPIRNTNAMQAQHKFIKGAHVRGPLALLKPGLHF